LRLLIALADRLKMPIEKVMQLSALELDIWHAYLKYEVKQANKQMRGAKHKYGKTKY
jgi:hypothetical protein